MPEKADPMSALRELEAGATPGPWKAPLDYAPEDRTVIRGTDIHASRESGPHWPGFFLGAVESKADAAFIVAAVEYVRAALRASLAPETDEVARIAAVLDRVGPCAHDALHHAARLYDAGLRAPSLDSIARHPEAGEADLRAAVEGLLDIFDRATMPGDDSTPLFDYLAHDARNAVGRARAILAASPGARHDVPGLDE